MLRIVRIRKEKNTSYLSHTLSRGIYIDRQLLGVNTLQLNSGILGKRLNLHLIF